MGSKLSTQSIQRCSKAPTSGYLWHSDLESQGQVVPMYSSAHNIASSRITRYA